MNFEHSSEVKDLIGRLEAFLDAHVYPLEKAHRAWTTREDTMWKKWPEMESLKEKAKAAGLWNLFLPREYGPLSPGLTNLAYAPLAERMGRVLWCSEVFNCSAPDTGNMEVLAKYGTPEQQKAWLRPLLDGSIRSAFLMTEPQVASSDATNIETSITADGDEYLINGHKWWSSGALHEHCDIFIVMGKTDPTAERHQQQSMILVPRATPGVQVMGPLRAMGLWDGPGGHGEVKLNQVRVPKNNLLLGEGRGFEIAQGRLGPGRIHHCMRLIGMAQRSLELMCQRSTERATYGKKLRDYSSIRQEVAQSRCEIEQARLLTLAAADRMDQLGNKGAKELISMIKIVTPGMTQKVVDRAMQIFGGAGINDRLPLHDFFAWARILRLADGPDEVHMYQLGRNTIDRYAQKHS